MPSVIEPYAGSVAAFGAAAALMLVQLVIADVTGIVRKHAPGTAVREDHSDVLFRVTRTVANTNESIGIFVCALLFCVLAAASPWYTAVAAWAYVGFRLVYAICYYSNLQTARSIAFGLSVASLLALLIIGTVTRAS